MKESISIRPAEARDRKELSDLWLSLLQEQAELDDRVSPAGDALKRWSNDFAAWIRDDSALFLVAELSGDLCGFVHAETSFAAPIYRARKSAFISEIYVSEEYRKEGIGEELVKHVRTWAEEIGADEVQLSVLFGNDPARKFWEEMGASPRSVRYGIEVEKKEASGEERKPNLGF